MAFTRRRGQPIQKNLNEALSNFINQITKDELYDDESSDLYNEITKIIGYEVNRILKEEIKKFYFSQDGRDLIKAMHDDMFGSENEKTADKAVDTISSEPEIENTNPRRYYDDGGWDLAEIVGGEDWLTDDEAGR